MSASFYDKNSSLYNKPSKDTYKTQTPKTNQQHLNQTLNIKNKTKEKDKEPLNKQKQSIIKLHKKARLKNISLSLHRPTFPLLKRAVLSAMKSLTSRFGMVNLG
ncbi:hypothetical protein, partial [Helicobacter pylori]|uniref:hypothetical protein n=1 Tax=Helicobacter pylori TaxID=210 RepID=UPI001C4A10D3